MALSCVQPFGRSAPTILLDFARACLAGYGSTQRRPPRLACCTLDSFIPGPTTTAADAFFQATVASPADTAKMHRVAKGGPILVRGISVHLPFSHPMSRVHGAV
jgi:hypothetical protein